MSCISLCVPVIYTLLPPFNVSYLCLSLPPDGANAKSHEIPHPAPPIKQTHRSEVAPFSSRAATASTRLCDTLSAALTTCVSAKRLVGTLILFIERRKVLSCTLLLDNTLPFITAVILVVNCNTMPRGARARRVAQQPPSTAAGDTPVSPGHHSPPPPTRQTGKKRTVAENALAIDSLHSKLESMSVLLTQVAGHMQHTQARQDESLAQRSPAPDAIQPEYGLRTRHRSDIPNTDNTPYFRQRYKSASHLAAPATCPDFFQQTTRDYPHTREMPLHPPADRNRRLPPSTLQELDESTDLQDRVAHIVSAALAPQHLSGKKLYAHSYVRRGAKKVKTTLGDLSLAEYNLGFIKLINSREVIPADRPHMFQHLEYVNEDAISHPFSDVRAWSESVCVSIADGDMSWEDHYKIDLMRITMSQNGPAGRVQGGDRREASRRGADTGALDPQADFSAEVLAARPGPPCRMYNNGSCSQKHHHVYNGFRQLHVCSSCVYYKCSLIPHPEKECKSKEYRKKQAKEDLGFGK